MMLRFALGLLALSLGTVPAQAQQAGAPQTTPAAEARDWTTNVTATTGGWRMGNPDAAVRLVEYASISCSHCAHFSTDAARALRDNYVRTGRVSWEIRPVVSSPHDAAIIMAAGCGALPGFFDRVERLFATQVEWLRRLDGKNEDAAPAQTLRESGILPMLEAPGVTAATIEGCVGEPATVQRFARDMNARADEVGIEGTPTFLINDRMTDASQWNSPVPGRGVEPLLRAALGETR